VADHMTAEQAAASAHDQFKRAVLAEIELLAEWTRAARPANDSWHGFCKTQFTAPDGCQTGNFPCVPLPIRALRCNRNCEFYWSTT